MAGLAADPLVDVDRMVEVHEIGEVIHARPLERTVRAVALADRLEVGALQPDLGVAVHARLRRRDPGEGGLLDGGVAIAAVDPDGPHVVRVRELDRLCAGDVLLGCVGGSLEVVEDPESEAQEKDGAEDRGARDGVRRAVKDLRHGGAILLSPGRG